jgi:hypothetical protein
VGAGGPFGHVRGQTPDVAGSDSSRAGGSIVPMTDQTPAMPLEQQLEEIGAQLAWVRDYL